MINPKPARASNSNLPTYQPAHHPLNQPYVVAHSHTPTPTDPKRTKQEAKTASTEKEKDKRKYEGGGVEGLRPTTESPHVMKESTGPCFNNLVEPSILVGKNRDVQRFGKRAASMLVSIRFPRSVRETKKERLEGSIRGSREAK